MWNVTGNMNLRLYVVFAYGCCNLEVHFNWYVMLDAAANTEDVSF